MSEEDNNAGVARSIEGDREPATELTTTRSENKMRDVKIKQLNHGFFVEVGCHQFAIETGEKLLSALGEYMKDPNGIEKKWLDGKFLK